jgi:glycosyl transferase family 25
MEIFVINLRRSVRRRELMQRQLDRLGLRYRIFEATDGAELTEEEVERLSDPEARAIYRFTRGQVGCVVTKQRLYRTLVDEGIDSALILEDDLTLPDHLPQLLPQLEAQLRSDEVILLLGLPTYGCELSTRDTVTLGRHQLRYPMAAGQLTSGTAFMLRRPVAAALAEILLPMHTSSDWWGAFHAEGAFRSLRCLWPSPITLSLDLPSDSRARGHGHPLVRSLRNYVQDHAVFPVSNLLAWRRRALVGQVLRSGRETNQRSPLAADTVETLAETIRPPVAGIPVRSLSQ